MMAELTKWLVDTILGLGYPGIFLLMGVESSFIPFPSEVVLIPAGYLAAKGEMNTAAILAAAVAGSLLGALVNYYLALWLGRPFLVKFGRYFLISEESLDKLERFFETHGPISTFTGRLIPGIRQLISIPAGLSKMRIGRFLGYTAAGAAIWSLILILLGYFIGENEALLKTYLHQITIVVIAAAAVTVAVYVYRHKRAGRR